MFSAFLSYTLLLVDLGLIAWLSLHAYKDADTLDRFVSSHSPLVQTLAGIKLTDDRCEVPFFGPLASSILDDE